MALTEIDRSLLERCLKRDGSAWREFVDRFSGLFVHVIRHTGQARSVDLGLGDVDDLSAEIFLTILADDFAVLRRFKGESSLATYLTVIARRIVVREVVRLRMAEVVTNVKQKRSSAEMLTTDVNEITRIENRELVDRMLEGLSNHDALVVRKFHMEGKSYRQISEQMGIPENSIGPTLTRAREKLRQSLTAASLG